MLLLQTRCGRNEKPSPQRYPLPQILWQVMHVTPSSETSSMLGHMHMHSRPQRDVHPHAHIHTRRSM